MNQTRIGVVNWDASLPAETYFGYYQTRTLSPKKYREYTPYYADVLGENKIAYHKRSAEEFDRELSYAIEAGIDYFAYVFYPDRGSREHISLTYSDCSHRVYELNYARRMHMSSSLRDKIGIAAIVSTHPFTDEDIAELVDLLTQPYYERIDDRPLVYIYCGIREDIIERIRVACEERGIPCPFFAAMVGLDMAPDQNYSLVDALSAYACQKIGTTKYEDLVDEIIEQNRLRLGKCTYIIPHFSVGWDPSPRVDIPSPWYTYDNTDYPRIATGEQMLAGAKRFADWIEAEVGDSHVGHILTFAWNEFEEGAWICPTYRPDLSVNEERIHTFKKITQVFGKKEK